MVPSYNKDSTCLFMCDVYIIIYVVNRERRKKSLILNIKHSMFLTLLRFMFSLGNCNASLYVIQIN